MSYSKLASEVIVGDLVWRAGQYWLVYGITATHGTALEFQLRGKAGERTNWAYRSDFDVAVGSRAEVVETAAQ